MGDCGCCGLFVCPCFFFVFGRLCNTLHYDRYFVAVVVVVVTAVLSALLSLSFEGRISSCCCFYRSRLSPRVLHGILYNILVSVYFIE